VPEYYSTDRARDESFVVPVATDRNARMDAFCHDLGNNILTLHDGHIVYSWVCQELLP